MKNNPKSFSQRTSPIQQSIRDTKTYQRK